MTDLYSSFKISTAFLYVCFPVLILKEDCLTYLFFNLEYLIFDEMYRAENPYVSLTPEKLV